MKPRLLDLFCGAGGCTRGYQQAGFYVVGVDLAAQPRYCGDEFHQADALTFPLDGFDVIHASPPCQGYTAARNLQGNEHPRLIERVRERLRATGLPYVIENVPGAPLLNPTELCGTMFGLRTYRHRLFESSVPLPLIGHHPHGQRQVKMGRPVGDGDYIQVVGHFSNVEYGRRVMGTPWMTQTEMAEAIPPAYTEWIGRHLLAAIEPATSECAGYPKCVGLHLGPCSSLGEVSA